MVTSMAATVRLARSGGRWQAQTLRRVTKCGRRTGHQSTDDEDRVVEMRREHDQVHEAHPA